MLNPWLRPLMLSRKLPKKRLRKPSRKSSACSVSSNHPSSCPARAVAACRAVPATFSFEFHLNKGACPPPPTLALFAGLDYPRTKSPASGRALSFHCEPCLLLEAILEDQILRHIKRVRDLDQRMLRIVRVQAQHGLVGAVGQPGGVGSDVDIRAAAARGRARGWRHAQPGHVGRSSAAGREHLRADEHGPVVREPSWLELFPGTTVGLEVAGLLSRAGALVGRDEDARVGRRVARTDIDP